MAWCLVASLPLGASAAPSPVAPTPVAPIPVAPVRPVVDDYFGVQVIDPYRWMETAGDELQDYMRAEDAMTRQALAPWAAQKASLLARLTGLATAIPAVRSTKRILDDYIYLETPPDRNDAILKIRPVAGGTARVLLDPATFAHTDQHAAIDFFEPSWDGRHVIVGVSLGGSENSTLHVIETRTARLLPDAISRAQEAAPSWDEDSRGFHYGRLQELAPGAAASAKFENMRVYHHVLGTDPDDDVAEFGPDVVTDPVLPKLGYVSIAHLRGTSIDLATQVTGVVETPAIWRRDPRTHAWRPIARHEDGVLRLAAHGTILYVISKAAAVNGQLLRFDAAKEAIAEAQVVMPPSDLILSSQNAAGVAAARDALYLRGLRNGASVLLRVPYAVSAAVTPAGTAAAAAAAASRPAELALPINGSAQALAVDDRRPGFTFAISGWIASPRIYRYGGTGGTFDDTGLQLPNPADTSAFIAIETEALSADGARIPLSIIFPRDTRFDGSHPTLLEAYGAYGISLSPVYSTAQIPWLERGGILAIAHVRGGGEKGEAWHLAGMKQTKQHTIDDFVACARYLIEHGYTSSAHLGIEGTSAGGIAVGGFLTQHPELVGAVLYRVGITDILRSEQRSTGASNAAEYGSTRNESEFRAMYAISPYAHVTDGTSYPAILLETGANDPRVTSWMLTKMTARLQQANASGNPILLRVDFDAGHGIGSNRRQALDLKADEYTFLGWRLGLSGFAAAAEP